LKFGKKLVICGLITIDKLLPNDSRTLLVQTMRFRPLFIAAILTLSLVFTDLSLLRAQVRVSQLSLDNGLSQNTVNVSVQDTRGYLWIGTDDGLNRFDGKQNTVFRHIYNDAQSIVDNEVHDLLITEDSTLWIATSNGVSYFDPSAQSFHSVQYNPNAATTMSDFHVEALAETADGSLWLGTTKGLDRYNRETGEFKNYSPDTDDPQALPNGNIRELVAATDGGLWVSTDAAISKLDIATNTFRHYRLRDASVGFVRPERINCASYDAKGTFWVMTSSKLYYFEPSTDQFVPLTPEKNNVPESFTPNLNNTFAPAPNGGIWVLDQVALYKISHKNLQAETYPLTEFSANLASIDTRSVYVDPNGIVWMGTGTNGILAYDEGMRRFAHYKPTERNQEAFTSALIWNFAKKENDLWVATNDDLVYIDRLSNIYISAGKALFSRKTLVTSVSYDQTGRLWVSGINGESGIKIIKGSNPEDLKVLASYRRGVDMPRVSVLNLMEDSKGRMWGAGFGGVIRIYNHDDPKNLQFKHYGSGNPPPSNLSNSVVWALYEDHQGSIWAGTEKGLCRAVINEQDSVVDWECLLPDPNSEYGLSNGTVKTMVEDGQGNFWLGTDNGLNLYNRETRRVTHFGDKHKELNNAIYGVLCDEEDNLWMSTNNGLLKYDPKLDKVTHFTEEDGLQSNEFNTGAYYQGEDGELFFGGINGFNSFYPKDIAPSTYEPPVIISELRVFNERITPADSTNNILNKDISLTKAITLDYTQYNFSLEITALNYTLPEKTEFAYKLDNFDKEWNYIGKRNFISFTNLPQGDYTLLVKAANSDGVWSEKITKLEITIKPPIWKEWWFITGAVIAALLLIFAVYRQRVSSIQKQKAKLEELVRKRTQEVVDKNAELEAQKAQIKRSYDNISVISEIGQRITASLEIETIISTVYHNVNRMMDANAFGIGVFDAQRYVIRFQGAIENDTVVDAFEDALDTDDSLATWSFKNNSEIIINDFEKEHSKYIKGSIRMPVGEKHANSIIYLPLSIESQVIGVMTVQSSRKNAYPHQEQTILRPLASYVSIALANAKSYLGLREARDEIKEKSESLMSSIKYGQTIQNAILPNRELLEILFPQSFLIYRPKDIVSGDFYWLTETAAHIYVAVVDCTGHGVPGAFMSLIGHTLLNDIVHHKKVLEPGEMLEHLHLDIRLALHQDEEQNDDGMDMLVCRIARAHDAAQKREVVFGGAHRPLFYVHEGEFREIKGDRKSIGGRQKEDHRSYEQHKLMLNEGDNLYLTTDGYVDQNDVERMKLGTLRFLEIMNEVYKDPLPEQGVRLRKELDAHMQGTEQRDDITMLGLQI